jgi:hypothetical protein
MDLNKAQKKIRNAWIAGIGFNVIILIGALYIYLTGEHILAVLVSLVYIYVASGLIFGTYKRSRICVTAMFILLTMAFANAMYNMLQEALTTKEPPNDMIIIVPFIVVLYFIFEGIRGTFAYHKLIKNHENRETEN